MFSYDINDAKDIVSGINISDGFNRIYSFTTENISGYIDYFNLQDTSLLTVGSSCDQAINAMYKGCKNVTILDKNPFVKYYYFLKLAAINTLSRKEFLDYFKYYDHPKVFKKNINTFNQELFNKLSDELKSLDYKSYLFWKELYYSYPTFNIRTELFQSDEPRTDVVKEFNIYLISDENYNNTKTYLEANFPTFMIDDVISPYTKKTFDNIWLSNITSWIDSYEDINTIIKNMYSLLNNDGLLQAAYLYDYNDNQSYKDNWKKIYNIKTILDNLKIYNPEIKSFIGESGIKYKLANIDYEWSDCNDAIILCKKR